MKEEYDFSRGERGAVEPLPQGKTRITIRLDDDILDWFRDQVHQADYSAASASTVAVRRGRLRRRRQA